MSSEKSPPQPIDLFDTCDLIGEDLDFLVAQYENTVREYLISVSFPHYSTSWADAGPIIERDQMFIDPPTVRHVYFGAGDQRNGYYKEPRWTVTVSADTRTIPNRNDPKLPEVVGRGAGPTLLVAAMRAYVVSKGYRK